MSVRRHKASHHVCQQAKALLHAPIHRPRARIPCMKINSDKNHIARYCRNRIVPPRGGILRCVAGTFWGQATAKQASNGPESLVAQRCIFGCLCVCVCVCPSRPIAEHEVRFLGTTKTPTKRNNDNYQSQNVYKASFLPAKKSLRKALLRRLCHIQ